MNSHSAATALRDAIGQLSKAGVPDAARDARILLADALACETGVLAAALERDLAPTERARFDSLIAARCRRQPVSQITGRRNFWRHSFRVTPDVLDPRPETETIIELALQTTAPQRLLDLGTGSGCLAISLLAHWPEATALATDVSAPALKVAQANAEDAGVAGRLELRATDWFEGLEGRFDLVVCNPPYISASEIAGLDEDVRRWEPMQALTPGGDGLAAYRKLSKGLTGYLAPGGRALFEIGHLQARSVTALFQVAGWRDIRLHKDLGGRDRVVEIG